MSGRVCFGLSSLVLSGCVLVCCGWLFGLVWFVLCGVFGLVVVFELFVCLWLLGLVLSVYMLCRSSRLCLLCVVLVVCDVLCVLVCVVCDVCDVCAVVCCCVRVCAVVCCCVLLCLL